MAEDASKKVYFHLAQLSTEELETILRASALSENIDNLDLVDYILEVIVLREQEKNNALDIEQARKDFDQYYRDLDTPLYPSTNNEAATKETAPYQTCFVCCCCYCCFDNLDVYSGFRP